MGNQVTKDGAGAAAAAGDSCALKTATDDKMISKLRRVVDDDESSLSVFADNTTVSVPETMMSDSCYYDEEEEDESSASSKQDRNQHSNSGNEEDQADDLTCPPREIPQQQSAETENEAAAEQKHPLCSVLSLFHTRQPSLLETAPLQDDDDATALSCTSAWSSRQPRDSCSNPVPARRINSWLSFPSPSSLDTDNATSSANRNLVYPEDKSNTTADSYYTPEEWALSDHTYDAVSNLRDVTRPIWIVTTAALPWMTGTAVNPLLRAAYLIRYRQNSSGSTAACVNLVLPWLESSEDRVALYGPEWADLTKEDQASYIRDWLATKAVMPDEAASLQLHFYNARYHSSLSSIFAMGDVMAQVHHAGDDHNNAILILEEPEHLNYYRAPEKICQKSDSTTPKETVASDGRNYYTIGICHTNYKYYAQQHGGWMAAQTVEAVSAALVRGYCDQVIKLSNVLQEYAPHKEVVVNVHGIRNDFLTAERPIGNKIYFIGKLIWAKGLDQLIDLQELYRHVTGEYFEMDMYGSGPEQEEIQRVYLGEPEVKSDTTYDASSPKVVTTAEEERKDEDSDSANSPPGTPTDKDSTSPQQPKNPFASWYKRTPQGRRHRGRKFRKGPPLPVSFCGRLDHAAIGADYKIFVNPSVSEVLCTTTAEALAMGKYVVLPRHPSNAFFEDFDNALFYSTPEEFVQQLMFALETDVPSESSAGTPVHHHPLSWEAATERLLEAACVSERDAARRRRLGRDDSWYAQMHYEMGRGRTGDVLRKVLGGGPVADQARYQHSRSTM